jgi:quercetin dioxygenase-like cupin family protein
MIGGGPAAAVVKATAESTGGGFTMSDSTIAPGFPGPPAHSHQRITDTFYVLEGTLTVRLGNDFVDAPAGTYVCIPPGNVHTFSNRGNAQVRFLNINASRARFRTDTVARSNPRHRRYRGPMPS